MPRKKQKYPQPDTIKKWGCTTKMGFNTKEGALESKKHTNIKTRAYQCEHCGLWHTTRRKQHER